MIDPGRRRECSKSARDYLPPLTAFRDGHFALDEPFNIHMHWIESWLARFKEFYLDGLDRELAEIALASVAWCAAAEDRHPRKMPRLVRRDRGGE